MRVLISGAGIAGPTLAYWLAHYGFKPTLIESAPGLRTGGYIIDFWGAGFDIADRMGLLPQIRCKGYNVKELRVVDRCGSRVAGFPVEAFSRLTHGHYTSLPRAELAASIFGKIEGSVETIFGDSVSRIEQSGRDVRVTFKGGAVREFDLVVGAMDFIPESANLPSALKANSKNISASKSRLSKSRVIGQEMN